MKYVYQILEIRGQTNIIALTNSSKKVLIQETLEPQTVLFLVFFVCG
jgi:hypothetical protein